MNRTLAPPIAPHMAMLAAILATACQPAVGGLSTAWPEWQRIEFDSVPSAWQMEEASMAFDAWQATGSITVARLDDATLLRVSDEEDRTLEARITSLPPRVSLPSDQPLRFSLILRHGFEGVAAGLTVRDTTGALLLLYDDGGYGPAFYESPERDGVEIGRDLTGPSSRGAWVMREVTFGLADASVTLSERDDGPIGTTGLHAQVVVSREWTGPPPTDIDLTPLAYLIYRVPVG